MPLRAALQPWYDAAMSYLGYDIDEVDHDARINERALDQHLDKPRLRALSAAFAIELQEIEQAALDVLVNRATDVAEGASLEQIARIVSQAITTSDVATLRLLVKTRIVVRRSFGTINDLLAILRTFIPGEQRLLTEYFPAAVLVGVPDDIGDELASAVIELLAQATAGGVATYLVYLAEPTVLGEELRLSDATDWPGGAPKAFNDSGTWPAGPGNVFAAVKRS